MRDDFRQTFPLHQSIPPRAHGCTGRRIRTSRSGDNEKLARRLAENPHFIFADAERRGYGVVDFRPQGLTATLRVVDDVTRADTGISTLARFAVAAGRSVVERA